VPQARVKKTFIFKNYIFKKIIIFKNNKKFKIDIAKQTDCDTLEMLIFVLSSNKIKISLRKSQIVFSLSPHIVGELGSRSSLCPQAFHMPPYQRACVVVDDVVP